MQAQTLREEIVSEMSINAGETDVTQPFSSDRKTTWMSIKFVSRCGGKHHVTDTAKKFLNN